MTLACGERRASAERSGTHRSTRASLFLAFALAWLQTGTAHAESRPAVELVDGCGAGPMVRRLLLELRGVGLRVRLVHRTPAGLGAVPAADARVTLAADCSARVVAPSKDAALPVARPLDESDARDWAMTITEQVVALTGYDGEEGDGGAAGIRDAEASETPPDPPVSATPETRPAEPARVRIEASRAEEESAHAPGARHAPAGRLTPTLRGGALVWLNQGSATAMIRGDLRIALRRGFAIDVGAFGAAATQSTIDTGRLATRPIVATIGASWRRALRPPRLDLVVGARLGGGSLRSESVSSDTGTLTSHSAVFVAAVDGTLLTRLGGGVSLVTGLELGLLRGRALPVPSDTVTESGSAALLVPTTPMFTGISVGVSVDFGTQPSPAAASRLAQRPNANDS